MVGGQAQGVNDNGQVVGAVFQAEFSDLKTQGRFAIWRVDAAGAVTNIRNLGTLGGVAATAWDNNGLGNVAGDIWFDGTQTGFFWSENGGVVEINTDEAFGINDLDEVVGIHLGGNNGYVWSAAGGLTVMPDRAFAINNSSQVTGVPDSGVGPAWIWENGEVKLLPMPENRDFSWGLSINEAGWIVGWTTDVDGNNFANLWIPN